MAIGIGLIIALVLLVCALGLIAFVIGVYNKLVTMRNRYKNAYAQIDVQLKRRYDLIPNLVEIAKGYIKHERETLENCHQGAQHRLRRLAGRRRQSGRCQRHEKPRLRRKRPRRHVEPPDDGFRSNIPI